MTVTVYCKHLLSFLLIGFAVAYLFLSNQENIYMVHNDLGLFCDIYDTIIGNNVKSKSLLLISSKLF